MNTMTPWDVSAAAFPHAASRSAQFRYLINYAVLAPSGHNTQPWRFQITGTEIELYADPARALPAIDPANRELIMSCGAALFYLRVAARRFGFVPAVRIFPDAQITNLMATLRLTHRVAPTPRDLALFQAMTHRRTHRQAFTDRPVPAAETIGLQEAALEEGAQVRLLTTPQEREHLKALVKQAVYLQANDPAFRTALAGLMRSNKADATDGLPGYVYGLSTLRTHLAQLAMRSRIKGEDALYDAAGLIDQAPLLAVLTTATDKPADWLRAGQALAHLLLQAADWFLSASFLNQPLQVPKLAPRVQSLLQNRGHALAILRIGYGGDPPPRTPRRPVDEVVH